MTQKPIALTTAQDEEIIRNAETTIERKDTGYEARKAMFAHAAFLQDTAEYDPKHIREALIEIAVGVAINFHKFKKTEKGAAEPNYSGFAQGDPIQKLDQFEQGGDIRSLR